MLREGPFFECTQNVFPVYWKKFSSALQKIRELTQKSHRAESKGKSSRVTIKRESPPPVVPGSGDVKLGWTQKVTPCLTPCDPLRQSGPRPLGQQRHPHDALCAVLQDAARDILASEVCRDLRPGEWRLVQQAAQQSRQGGFHHPPEARLLREESGESLTFIS